MRLRTKTDYSRFRKLNLDASIRLHDMAMTGDKNAIQGYLAYSIWKKIKASPGFNYKQKLNVFNAMMKKISIKVI